MDRVERRERSISAGRAFRVGKMLAKRPAALDRDAAFGEEEGRPLLWGAGQGRRAP
jgi:hypothetical protein